MLGPYVSTTTCKARKISPGLHEQQLGPRTAILNSVYGR